MHFGVADASTAELKAKAKMWEALAGLFTETTVQMKKIAEEVLREGRS